MTQISASQARQDFLQILNRAYAGEEFLVTKNKIAVATIAPVRREKKVIKRRIDPKVFGMWKNRKEWKGLSTVEIADRLRELAWKGSYGD